MGAGIIYMGVILGADFIFGGGFVRIHQFSMNLAKIHQFSMNLAKITMKRTILMNFTILLRIGPNECRNRAQRIELPPNPPFHHILVHFSIDQNLIF